MLGLADRKGFSRHGLTGVRGLLLAALLTFGFVVVPVAAAATPANPLLSRVAGEQLRQSGRSRVGGDLG